MADPAQHQQMPLTILYRTSTFHLSATSDSSIRQLGEQLQALTGVAPQTMRLLVPQSHRSAPSALLPFSDAHASILLGQSGIQDVRVIRMMGALPEEIKEVSTEAGQRYGGRILGFSEEEERAKQRLAIGAGASRKLPQGRYVFGDFRTLQLPGIQLDPPPEKALDIMHRLASDPGIIAIMNKHYWNVGVMTEMAPVGYVGISPKCLLGYNKNFGEEISLRLRTDDLKGFRKYDSIKKTLLHELAHMVHSEHDANFFALDKQLNEEAISLDWTKAKSHTVSGWKHDEERGIEAIGGAQMENNLSNGYKLGGNTDVSRSAKSAAAVAAIQRFANNFSLLQAGTTAVDMIPECEVLNEPALGENLGNSVEKQELGSNKCEVNQNPGIVLSGEADKILRDTALGEDPGHGSKKEEMKNAFGDRIEPDPDDADAKRVLQDNDHLMRTEPDPDDSEGSSSVVAEPDPDEGTSKDNLDPDEAMSDSPYLNGSLHTCGMDLKQDIEIKNASVAQLNQVITKSFNGGAATKLDGVMSRNEELHSEVSDLISDDIGLKVMQESVQVIHGRLQQAIAKLKEEATPTEAAAAIQTLFTIFRNVMEHPLEAKFKRLRKTNPAFQNRVAKFQGALEVLHAAGFSEGPSVETGENDCLILHRNDPGILWLARTSLETSMA
eukprot:c25413_g1_i1 orf=416-2413(-)